MKSKNIFFAIALVCITTWLLWPEELVPVRANANPVEIHVPQSATHEDRPAVRAISVTSPFGIGTPNPPDPKETEARIRQVFKAAGLRTPERYYSMGVKQLSELAASGDVYANIQLGTRYLFTPEALEFDPDYDFSVNAKVEAFTAFRRVAMLGNSPAIAMLATKLADVDPVEAFAWDTIAATTSQDIGRDFYRDNRFNFRLTNDQIATARQHTLAIERAMLALPPVALPPQ